MSKADQFASGKSKWENNEQIAAAVADVLAVHRRGVDGMKNELELGLIDDGNEIRDMSDEDRAGREGRVANARSHRYEVLDDDSVIEIILEGDSDQVEIVARPNLVTDPRGLIAGGADATTPAETNGSAAEAPDEE